MKDILKKLIPKEFLRAYVDFKNRNKSVEDVFTEIYDKNHWGLATDGRKYFSGYGTDTKNVALYQKVLSDFIIDRKIETIFEIGCGDFTIMDKVVTNNPNIIYKGFDVVKSLVQYLQKEYCNQRISFFHSDNSEYGIFPNADLCIIRQVLQHLSNAEITKILVAVKKYKYVMITEHLPLHPKQKNGDKSTNGYIRMQNKNTSGVFLNDEPFSQNSIELISYRQDDIDYHGKIIPAQMLTSLIINNIVT